MALQSERKKMDKKNGAPCPDCGQVHGPEHEAERDKRITDEVEGVTNSVMLNLHVLRKEHGAHLPEREVVRLTVAIALARVNGAIPALLKSFGPERLAKTAPGVAAELETFGNFVAHEAIVRGRNLQ